MKDFYKKKGGARELLTEEKKGLFWSQEIFSLEGGVGESTGRVFTSRLPLLFKENGKGPYKR